MWLEPLEGDTGDEDESSSALLSLVESSSQISLLPQGPCALADYRACMAQRLLANPKVAAFIHWVQGAPTRAERIRQFFIGESTNPAAGTRCHSFRGITRSRWIDAVQKMGYKNCASASEVFDEIAHEISPDKVSRTPDVNCPPEEPTIVLQQWTHFQRRARCIRAELSPSEDKSPAARFCRALRRQRGCVLRAWRLDLDVRGTGRVAYVDFLAVSRKLGFSAEAKLIWNSLLQDKGTLLELHDLCPEEASNLEEFVERLHNHAGPGLDRGWRSLDTDKQNFMTLADFRLSLRCLGFQGDARLLFRGLDVSGHGRIWQSEFHYIGKVSRLFQRQARGRQRTKAALLLDFGSWVESQDGGMEEILECLGFIDPEDELEVETLAARLEELGFDGDCAQVAELAAQSESIWVSAQSLQALLSGDALLKSQDELRDKSRVSAQSSLAAQSPRGPVRRFEWDSGVYNESRNNTHKCKYTRDYFTPLESPLASPREQQPITEGTVSTPVRSATTVGAPFTPPPRRPMWNGSHHAAPALNTALHPHSRHGFSDPYDKPVRAEIHAKLQRRQRLTNAR